MRMGTNIGSVPCRSASVVHRFVSSTAGDCSEKRRSDRATNCVGGGTHARPESRSSGGVNACYAAIRLSNPNEIAVNSATTAPAQPERPLNRTPPVRRLRPFAVFSARCALLVAKDGSSLHRLRGDDAVTGAAPDPEDDAGWILLNAGWVLLTHVTLEATRARSNCFDVATRAGHLNTASEG